MSVQTIQRNPQDISSFYLAHIYQELSTQSNGSQPSIPSTLTNPIEPFIPPRSGVWANGLWFLSLVISLTCALAALLLQQWARRYLRVAYPRHSPHKRARLRAFYMHGVQELRIPLTIELIPALLHLSLFLFFAGLSVYLFGVHRTIFKVVTAWIGVCIGLYAYLTVLPIIHKNSPCSSPLSSSFSFCLTGIRSLFFRLGSFTLINNMIHKLYSSRHLGEVHLDNFFSRSMIKTAEEYAFKLKPDIDHKSLLWTFDSLYEDADYEKFFDGLPRLCDSEIGRELELINKFIKPNKEKLSNALIGLIDRTLVSNLVEEFVKLRRMFIFIKAIESKSISLFDPLQILRRVLFEDWHGLLGYIEFGLSMRDWTITSSDDRVTTFYAQCIATLTISTIENGDKSWVQLATVDGHPLSRALHHHEDYHSILLANAIYVVRMSVQTYSGSEDTNKNDILGASRKTLRSVCKLDIRQTLPELQHEFCDLWNKLVRAAQTDQLYHHRFVSVKMLKSIRKLYIALHSTSRTDFDTTDDWEQVLDNSSFYPECTEDDHRSSSSFPDLQFIAPRTQFDAPTTSGVHFPEPYSPTRPIPSPSSPDQPTSPSFPVPEPYDPATN